MAFIPSVSAAIRIRTELVTGVPEVVARLRATTAAPDPGKTLYGVTYTVTDEADRNAESAFIWTICPATRIQAHLTTGVPELTARLRTDLSQAVRIQTELVTGVPAVVARVRTAVPDHVRIQAHLRTGVPEVTARLRLTSGRVRVDLTTGVPELTARLRVDTPDPARVRAQLATGVPEITALLRTLAATPHCQMFTLGRASFRNSSTIEWNFIGQLIDAELVAGGIEAFAGSISIRANGRIFFYTAAIMGQIGTGEGPQMGLPWEQNVDAIRLQNGDLELTIPGPDSALAVTRDETEPYQWTVVDSVQEQVQAFVDAYVRETDTQVRLCDYPIPDFRIRAALATGVPEVTARLRTSLVAGARIQTELITGIPTVTARLRTTSVAPQPGKTLYGVVYTVTDEADRNDASAFIWTICPAYRIQAHLETGVPAVAARLRIGVPGDIRVRAQLATGVPELTALLRILTPGETRVRAELRTGVPEVTARLRATMAAPDPGKTLYGVVYTVTDEADRNDASAFIWTICPAYRIQRTSKPACQRWPPACESACPATSGCAPSSPPAYPS